MLVVRVTSADCQARGTRGLTGPFDGLCLHQLPACLKYLGKYIDTYAASVGYP